MLTVTAACSGACPSGQYQSAACCATSDRVCTGKQYYVVFCFEKFSVVNHIFADYEIQND